MRECNPAKGAIAKRIARGRLSIRSKKEARLRIDERVAEPIQHNARDIASGVETGGTEQLRHLLTNSPLIIDERGGQQFGSAQLTLVARRQARLRKIHKEGEYRGQVRAHDVRVHPKGGILAHIY